MGESLRHRTAHGHPLMGINSYSQATAIYREAEELRTKLAAIRAVVDNAKWFDYDKYDGSLDLCQSYDALWVDADDMRKIADILDP